VKEGTRVRATTRIVEEDAQPNPDAGPCEPGWVHANEGDVGEVVFVEPDYTVIGDDGKMEKEEGPAVTVRFDHTETATLVFPNEVEEI